MGSWLLGAPGRWQPEPVVPPPVALLSGYSVFTTLRVPCPEPWLAAHWQRLVAHAAQLNLACPEGLEPLSALIKTWDPTTPLVLRLTVWPEVLQWTEILSAEGPLPAHLLVTTHPWQPSVGPVWVQPVLYERPLPQIKHGGYTADWLARRAARRLGADEVLRVNSADQLTESSVGNVFLITDAGLWTPDPVQDGCLDGLMRQAVLTEAPAQGWACQVGAIPRTALSQASGAFLTNSSWGIRPVEGWVADTGLRHPLPWPAGLRERLAQLAQALTGCYLPDKS
jgi:branched-subunit amino acid aminotransferase/4-amino-4-deoxychorismate lyase